MSHSYPGDLGTSGRLLGGERKYALAQRLACKTFWMLVDVSSYTFDLWLCFQEVIEIDLCEWCARPIMSYTLIFPRGVPVCKRGIPSIIAFE